VRPPKQLHMGAHGYSICPAGAEGPALHNYEISAAAAEQESAEMNIVVLVRGSGGYSAGSEILLRGERPFADAAPCRAVAPARAPQTRRPPPPGPPERVVSGSPSAAAPHRGGGRCRLSAARLRCGCLGDAAAAREERRGRCGRSPRRSPGRPGCRPTLWRARPGVVGPWRTRAANGRRGREPRSGRASEWLARPTAR
jgi:hypothetical protein